MIVDHSGNFGNALGGPLASWRLLGPSEGHLGRFGAIIGRYGPLLDCFGGLMGPSETILRALKTGPLSSRIRDGDRPGTARDRPGPARDLPGDLVGLFEQPGTCPGHARGVPYYALNRAKVYKTNCFFSMILAFETHYQKDNICIVFAHIYFVVLLVFLTENCNILLCFDVQCLNISRLGFYKKTWRLRFGWF